MKGDGCVIDTLLDDLAESYNSAKIAVTFLPDTYCPVLSFDEILNTVNKYDVPLKMSDLEIVRDFYYSLLPLFGKKVNLYEMQFDPKLLNNAIEKIPGLNDQSRAETRLAPLLGLQFSVARALERRSKLSSSDLENS